MSAPVNSRAVTITDSETNLFAGTERGLVCKIQNTGAVDILVGPPGSKQGSTGIIIKAGAEITLPTNQANWIGYTAAGSTSVIVTLFHNRA